MNFELKANLIVLDAIINGINKRFLLDTGACGTLVTRETAAELGLEEFEKGLGRGAGGDVAVSFVRVDSLGVNGAELKDLTCGTMDLAGINARLGGGIDGILGYDFLSHFKVTIDYRARKLTLDPYPTPAASGKGFRIEGDRFTSAAARLSLVRPDESWRFETDTPLPRIDVILEKKDTSTRVTVQHQTLEGLTLEQLLPSIEPSLRAQFEDFEELASAPLPLGGLHGHRIDYRGREDGADYRYRFVLAVVSGNVITLNCRASGDEFKSREEDFNRIIESVNFEGP